MVFGNRIAVFVCSVLMIEGMFVSAQDNSTVIDEQKDVVIIKDGNSKSSGKIKMGPIKNREIKGNGNVVSDSREVASSCFLEVEGAFEIDVTPTGGVKTEIQVSADANLLDNVKTVISGEKLMIYADKPYSTSNKINIVVKMPNFRGISSEGASNVKVHGIDADILSMQGYGASMITLEGKALLLRGVLEGAGDLNALKLSAEKVDLNMAGAAKAKVSVFQSLTVKATGAAEVLYAGRPVKINKALEGAAELKPYNNDGE